MKKHPLTKETYFIGTTVGYALLIAAFIVMIVFTALFGSPDYIFFGLLVLALFLTMELANAREGSYYTSLFALREGKMILYRHFFFPSLELDLKKVSCIYIVDFALGRQNEGFMIVVAGGYRTGFKEPEFIKSFFKSDAEGIVVSLNKKNYEFLKNAFKGKFVTDETCCEKYPFLKTERNQARLIVVQTPKSKDL